MTATAPNYWGLARIFHNSRVKYAPAGPTIGLNPKSSGQPRHTACVGLGNGAQPFQQRSPSPCLCRLSATWRVCDRGTTRSRLRYASAPWDSAPPRRRGRGESAFPCRGRARLPPSRWESARCAEDSVHDTRAGSARYTGGGRRDTQTTGIPPYNGDALRTAHATPARCAGDSARYNGRGYSEQEHEQEQEKESLAHATPAGCAGDPDVGIPM
jgi:hypothetical protein